jgi:putative peptidoglycan lipid II flippase
MSDNTRVTKAAGTVGAATFLSRIFGYVRDMILAGFFGAGPLADAFIAAFRIPNLLRRMLGEGSLGISFIPVFSEYLTKSGKQEAFRLAHSAVRLLSALLVMVALAGVFLAPWITKAVAFGFSDSPEQFALTVTLTRIMFPYIFFIGLVALCMGILNAIGHFAAPALAPILLNLAMIGSVLLGSRLTDDPQQRVYWLAGGVLAGGLLQLLLQFPFLKKSGFKIWQKAGFFHPGLKKVAVMFIPATFGAAVFQLNTLLGQLLASFLPSGSISYLYFADRLVQFPLGIFGISAATAVLPTFAKQSASADMSAFKHTFTYSLSMVFFISIPAMVGLIVLREPIVALLFQRGAFSAQAVRMTADALLYYAIGLWAFAAVRIVAAAFYAMQDTKTPVRIAVVSIAVNLLLGIVLMGPMAHKGLALALSVSASVNLVLLTAALRLRLGRLGGRKIVSSTCQTVVNSAIMGAVVWLVSGIAIPIPHGKTITMAGGLLVCILSGVTVYAILSYLWRGMAFNYLIRLIRGE